ncbi:MAG: M3 family oligoendopeptidase [Chthonomonadales bacterium]|nr:M3 family oligoendopeptidase [Chthonomonadales bacterium]
MGTSRRAGWVALVAVCVAGARAQAPARSPAPLPADPARYRIDFARVFFPNAAAEQADRLRLLEDVAALQRLRGRVASSPTELLRALELSNRVQARLARHFICRHLHYLLDTSDARSEEAATSLAAEVGRRISFLEPELARIDSARLKAWTAREPRLGRHRFEVERARRRASHLLVARDEELLAGLGPLLTGWQAEMHQAVVDAGPPAGDAAAPSGRGEGAEDPSRALRRDMQAFSLARLARARNRLARLRGFADASEEALFDLRLRPDDVRRMLDRLAAASALNRRFERARAARRTPAVAQSYAEAAPRFTLPQAIGAVRRALAPLGADYGQELAALLDPANGRVDLAGGAHRASLATGWGFPGSQPAILYMPRFDGSYADVDTMAHEAGHAVHFQLMGRAGVLPAYVDGPGYFTETFGMLNQLLLADDLLRREADPARRRYYLERLLTWAVYPFAAAENAALELTIYRSAAAGEPLTPHALDALAREAGARFSDGSARRPGRWADLHQLWTNPLYVTNYLYASLLALASYEQYARDPVGFVPRYLALMRGGFDAPPDELLRRHLGVDLRDPAFVAGALRLLERRLAELERPPAGE